MGCFCRGRMVAYGARLRQILLLFPTFHFPMPQRRFLGGEVREFADERTHPVFAFTDVQNAKRMLVF